MSTGKFEAGKNGRPAAPRTAGSRSSGQSGKYAAQRKPAASTAARGGQRDQYAARTKKAAYQQETNRSSKAIPILAAIGGVLVLALGIILFVGLNSRHKNRDKSTTEGTQPKGVSRAELEQNARAADENLRTLDMVLTLEPDTPEADGSEEEILTEEPIVVTVPAKEFGAHLDLDRLQADLDAEKGKTGDDIYVVDLAEYLVLDEETLNGIADQVAEEYGHTFQQTEVEIVHEIPEGEEEEAQFLVIHTGVTGRDITAEGVLEALHNGYTAAARGEDVETAFAPTMSYHAEYPEPVDAEKLYEDNCKAPVDATLDPSTYDIIPDEPGFGFDLEDLTKQLEETGEDEEIRIRMDVLEAEVTEQILRDSLFQDVLGEAHTPHTYNYDRTNNLILACEAIDGTVVMPGQVFSFNKTVGERTEEKGYKEAIAYVSGGASKPEVGGGVCQVASSIYYSVLQADLETVERTEHMFQVTYVPPGMDAAIYWGQLDYKFKNNSPFPIRIDASVSDGKVHIVLRGTEWKDYRILLDYVILETIEPDVVQQDVPNDGTYKEGEVISTPYTGAKVETYRIVIGPDGSEQSRNKIATSRYAKRDKTLAHIVYETQPTEPQPTQPQPTQPQPTEPQPTEPQPTEPQPTEPQPTEPQPTEPEPTEPQPTDPDPTDPPPDGG